ncbi:MAG: DUF5060 domain-containing protein [Chitinispirillaceae bacterium]|nr:DUF5060 domain-containing protein [Chitinispirillaceae bacterium]
MRTSLLILLLTGCFFASIASDNPNVIISGDTTDRHTMTFTIKGPGLSESGDVNPFTDYKLLVYFQYMLSGAEKYTVPGYYAADGNAGETGADSGNVWKAHFTPQWPGAHFYKVYFRTGPNVALTNDTADGVPVEGVDGDTGTFEFKQEGNDSPPDLKALGRLDIDKYKNHFVLVKNGFSEKKIFLKTGTASPSNFLDYADFDNTPAGTYTKTFTDHVADWMEGDPTWGGEEKGKGIIGAINYLAGQGVNTISFNTLTLGSPDSSIYPYSSPDNLKRFDCSKLDQWLKVFQHANSKGMVVELRTQMAANQTLLDNGDLDTTRILYYRELIARYAHCLGVMWNLGDENGLSLEQQLSAAEYIHSTDPHQHPSRSIVLPVPEGAEDLLQPLYSNDSTWISGASLQSGYQDVHTKTKKLVDSLASYEWVGVNPRLRTVTSDCQLPKETGVPADGVAGPPSQDDIRKYVLWGNLMAKGAGVSYYFGSEADLTCENFRSYENLWSYYRHAENFFRKYLLENEFEILLYNQLATLTNYDDIISEAEGYCLALDGYQPFVVYLPEGGNANIDISMTNPTDSLRAWWYNPRTGESLIQGNLLIGGSVVPIGTPPADPTEDWTVLIIPDDKGNPETGVAIQKDFIAGKSFQGIQSLTAYNGVVRMFVSPLKTPSSIEIIAANGKIIATSTPNAYGNLEFRLKTTGLYMVCRKNAGKRTIIARVLNM